MRSREESLHAPPNWLPATLDAAANGVTLERNTCLFRQKDPVRFIFFVQSGEMKAVRYQPDGHESVMMRALAGEFFAESSIITSDYACDGVSTRPSRLLAYPAALFLDLLADDSRFAFAFATHQASMARRQCTRYERLRLRRARDRVLHLLTCEADSAGCYILPGTRADLAAELGLEPETMYRALAELERAGVIACDRRSIHQIAHLHEQD